MRDIGDQSTVYCIGRHEVGQCVFLNVFYGFGLETPSCVYFNSYVVIRYDIFSRFIFYIFKH